MNAHTPFDAKQDWTNPYCQNSSNDPMVDALLGNAYHVVRTVYCNLGNLKLIYDFLNKYGMVLGVQSETELKAMPTSASYVRLYGFDNTNKRVVTDYLYVEGDRTGVIPDDTSATGSWILVATSNSDSGGNDGEGKASPPYIPYSYNNGSAIGGETTIPVPVGTVGVPMIVIDGYTNLVGYGFTYDAASLTVTLAQPLEPGDEVHLFLTGTPAVPDNPNVSDWVQINWLYNGGYASGGEQVIQIPYTFKSVPAIYKNGARYYSGLAENSYTVDADNQRILLTEPLATNDRLIVTIGGESETLIMTDRTIQEVARSANVKDTEIILSTNTTQYLNDKKVIYDVAAQKIYGLPALPTNVYINSVSNGQLTYSPGNITVDLNPVPSSGIDAANTLRADLASGNLELGDNLLTVKQPFTGSVVRTQHSKNTDVVSVKDFGAVGDGITDDSAAFNAAISALSTRGGSVYVPTGNYKVLNLNINVRTLDVHGNRIGFFGDGPALSVLIGSSAISTSYVMAVTANTTEAVNSVIAGVSFRDLGFEISNALGTPFRLVNTAYAHFSNCYFKGGRHAFESAGSLSSSFINCKFSEAAQYGFYAHDGFSSPNQLSFFQCVFTSNALAGMYAINPGGLRIYGGSIENNGASSTPTFGGGILIDTVTGSSGTSIPIVVSGTYFEFNKGLADLSITHANSLCNTSFSVDGCSFGQGGTYTTVDRVHIVHAATSALRGTVSNCNFHELSGFVPTSAHQYIGISGLGTGYRSIFNVNNYFNTAASAPADQTTRIPATAGFEEARIEKFSAVTGASAATATVSFNMFAATPNVQVTVVDGTADTIYSARVIAITANGCTVEVWKTTPSGGGTWTRATNTSVHILAVGPSK